MNYIEDLGAECLLQNPASHWMMWNLYKVQTLYFINTLEG